MMKHTYIFDGAALRSYRALRGSRRAFIQELEDETGVRMHERDLARLEDDEGNPGANRVGLLAAFLRIPPERLYVQVRHQPPKARR